MRSKVAVIYNIYVIISYNKGKVCLSSPVLCGSSFSKERLWDHLISNGNNSKQGRQSFPVRPKVSCDPKEVILQKRIWRRVGVIPSLVCPVSSYLKDFSAGPMSEVKDTER